MSKPNKIIRILAVSVIAAAYLYQAFLAVSVMVHGDIRHGMAYCLLVAVATGLGGVTCAALLRPVFEKDQAA